MTKGKGGKRGNKEAKKPKQEKPKVSATANSLAGKPALEIGGKKLKQLRLAAAVINWPQRGLSQD